MVRISHSGLERLISKTLWIRKRGDVVVPRVGKATQGIYTIKKSGGSTKTGLGRGLG